MTTRQLSQIWIYPVKSLGGISLQESILERRGLRYDRRWMLIDASGRFVSQREIPKMALLGTSIDATALRVFWKRNPQESIQIPLEIAANGLSEIQVDVWGDKMGALLLPESINLWFSTQLGQNLRLVYMPDTTRRPADARYAPQGQYVSFADGFPYLVIGQSTLDELNDRLEAPLPMNRFRPNFVFTGGRAFEEEEWETFSIHQQPFQGVKPCARCAIPTINQETAEQQPEPIKTLATYRKFENKILFGQNVIWLGEKGAVRVGDFIYP